MAGKKRKYGYTRKKEKRGKHSTDGESFYNGSFASGTTLVHETEFVYPRELLIEKYDNPSYIDKQGNKYWIDRYGDTIRGEHPNGNSIPILTHHGPGFRGEQLLEDGLIYAPYIPVNVITLEGIDLERAMGTFHERYVENIIDESFITTTISRDGIDAIAAATGFTISNT